MSLQKRGSKVSSPRGSRSTKADSPGLVPEIVYSEISRQKNSRQEISPEARIRAAIRAIPRGKVSTYGAVAAAAGLPGHSRQVARVLHRSFGLPWQRVLGAGGEIKLRGDNAIEQRIRLEAEGVRFRGRRMDMKTFEYRFPQSRISKKSRRRADLR